ncbi:MAG: hypothetical protein U9N19_02760, partial [Thermodesulfobacteriota bacterium]|nr:hypothetical protein [Thermodesulfobacteriota bacterium]
RWFHITENHDDLASYYFEVMEVVENQEFIIRGNKGSLKAAKNNGGRWHFCYFINRPSTIFRTYRAGQGAPVPSPRATPVKYAALSLT